MGVDLKTPNGKDTRWLSRQRGYLETNGPISEKTAGQLRRIITNARRRVKRRKSAVK